MCGSQALAELVGCTRNNGLDRIWDETGKDLSVKVAGGYARVKARLSFEQKTVTRNIVGYSPTGPEAHEKAGVIERCGRIYEASMAKLVGPAPNPETVIVPTPKPEISILAERVRVCPSAGRKISARATFTSRVPETGINFFLEGENDRTAFINSGVNPENELAGPLDRCVIFKAEHKTKSDGKTPWLIAEFRAGDASSATVYANGIEAGTLRISQQ